VKRAILLADDSPTIQRLVTQTFADANVEIVSVSNGDAAIRKFEELRPHLVLADIYMPGKNGYEVCTYVKNHPELSETPVVLLAGAFDAFDETQATQAGASAHITKPFEPQALVDLVLSLLPKLSQGESVAEPEPVPTAEVALPQPEAQVAPARAAAQPATQPVDHADLLGLEELFQPIVVETTPVLSVSDAEIERIADRVIQKLSTQVIESVAWDVVPDITAKVLREELKRNS
jgi:CheY-like chemotaxis protein